MIETLALHFQPGKSVLHQFDPRLKTLSLLVVSPSIMIAQPAGLMILSLALMATASQTGLKWRAVARELRYFGFLLLAVFLSRAVFTPGRVMIGVGPIQLTDSGIFSGLLICWRLVLVTMAGLTYAGTTRPKEIRAAVEWLLSPLPGIPAKRLGVMIGLVVRFIPLVLDQARETMAAQKARCVECRKNPYYRLTRFVLPVLRKTIKLADLLVMAMTARCYNESGTPLVMRTRPTDWAVFGVVLGLCIILISTNFLS
jgi:biotin transport system permease protein